MNAILNAIKEINWSEVLQSISLDLLILALQLLILFFQFRLQKNTYNSDQMKDSCHFTLISNLQAVEAIKRKYRHYYDLNKRLKFKAIGGINGSLVYVCGSSISINGIIKTNSTVPGEIYFEPNGDFSIMEVPLDLSTKELNAGSLAIIYTLTLKNKNGFKYFQRFNMMFKREKVGGAYWWYLARFNLELNNRDNMKHVNKAIEKTTLSGKGNVPHKTKTKQLKETLADLRARVHQLEQEKKNLASQLVDYKKMKSENERLKQQLLKCISCER